MTPYSSGEWYQHCKENCLKCMGKKSAQFRDGWNIARSVTELVGTNDLNKAQRGGKQISVKF